MKLNDVISKIKIFYSGSTKLYAKRSYR